jgi:ERCC4-type nuclease
MGKDKSQPIFISNAHFMEWLKNAPKTDIESYIKFWLLERQKEKHIVYGLCQVELRSLHMPGVNYLNRLFGDYYGVLKDLKFINKFEKFNQWEPHLELDKKRIIYCDSREQNLVKFKNAKTIIRKLEYGDYSFSHNEWTGKTYIERKSAADFIGTLHGKLERFEREIERAKKDNAYLIILVEAKLSDMMDYRNKRIVNYNIRIPSDVILEKTRKLIQLYSNIQFLFIESHEESSIIIERLFSLGQQVQKYDLQLLYDFKKI